ncbi:anthranilate synthase component I family protein [Polaromonas sp. JS666]|uniref:anthranilate synthase component I family protein n=1 Tax=Polaromonas sp. (strain JS666 / ATCC BAA-500) TaxID=296591 RepID=UPI00004648C9|nr:chorismate-binding protein [Polaromonas sp. JS666]ABE46344.1 anthranilate synthase, component I [Polaromonas sp. JS666]
MITELEFKSLASQGYNRIPLMLEAFADLETPLSLYLKLANAKDGGKFSFLLESVVGGERFGRYSFIGLPARTLIRCSGFGADMLTEVVKDGRVIETSRVNPLDFISDYQKRFKVALRPGLPRFCGGLAGYFGYDTVRYIEKKLEASCPPDTLGCPDIMLLQCEELAVIDNLSGKLYLIVYADPAQPEAFANAKKRLRELKEQLKYSVSAPVVKPSQGYPAERDFAKADYIAAVERAKRLIEAGDFMQVQVGQRIKKRYTESPLSLYRALRALNPSPYMYYYHFGDFHVVGASPEILVRQEQVARVAGPPQDANAPSGGSEYTPVTSVGAQFEQKITIRPLAGTRPRASSIEADKAVEQELVNDPKERAEHVMLIDLARNDIGRIAKTGTVKVTEAFAVERYSHVMHIVSNVEGVLLDGMTSMDVLKATFPAGTLTGAPKVHAMELIDQLEPTKRGLYGGACGYLSYAGDMDVAIAIRTGIIKDQTLYVQAAAGVVADSVPELEWKETEAKARALLRASELVEEGLE